MAVYHSIISYEHHTMKTAPITQHYYCTIDIAVMTQH